MICQKCNKNEASVHFTKIVNGKKTEVFLCEDCARESGHLTFAGSNPFDFTNLLKGILNPDVGTYSDYLQESKCDVCGKTYKDFTKNALFGCPHCYKEFTDRLDPILKRIHGNIRHNGKIPRRRGGMLRIRKEIEELREKMQGAVNNEDFERAAELRDKIKELERKTNSRGGDYHVSGESD